MKPKYSKEQVTQLLLDTAAALKADPAFNLTEEEMAALNASYEHLCAMREEIVALGIVPPVDQWKEMNPNL